jgi:hypothetical protein
MRIRLRQVGQLLALDLALGRNLKLAADLAVGQRRLLADDASLGEDAVLDLGPTGDRVTGLVSRLRRSL